MQLQRFGVGDGCSRLCARDDQLPDVRALPLDAPAGLLGCSHQHPACSLADTLAPLRLSELLPPAVLTGAAAAAASVVPGPLVAAHPLSHSTPPPTARCRAHYAALTSD